MPDSSFSLYTDTADLATGLQRGLGKSTTSWQWEVLTHTQRDSLKAYCTGLSADVFIRTLDEDNQYADYSAIMLWPPLEDIDAVGSVINFEVLFRQMVKQ